MEGENKPSSSVSDELASVDSSFGSSSSSWSSNYFGTVFPPPPSTVRVSLMHVRFVCPSVLDSVMGFGATVGVLDRVLFASQAPNECQVIAKHSSPGDLYQTLNRQSTDGQIGNAQNAAAGS
ncbi:hypothetical protein GW17_00055791 [Ensete ventricosum]|nr:hypothetical protein GW17_00055791 [Ensete ventricosum]